jgi:hypothetical protein
VIREEENINIAGLNSAMRKLSISRGDPTYAIVVMAIGKPLPLQTRGITGRSCGDNYIDLPVCLSGWP